jgi:hypothetical protein
MARAHLLGGAVGTAETTEQITNMKTGELQETTMGADWVKAKTAVTPITSIAAE